MSICVCQCAFFSDFIKYHFAHMEWADCVKKLYSIPITVWSNALPFFVQPQLFSPPFSLEWFKTTTLWPEYGEHLSTWTPYLLIQFTASKHRTHSSMVERDCTQNMTATIEMRNIPIHTYTYINGNVSTGSTVFVSQKQTNIWSYILTALITEYEK